MEITNLRKNIIEYRKTKDKKILEDLYIYFSSYIKNIGRRIYSDYKETDLIIKFIEVINSLNIRGSSDNEIQGKIVVSLLRKRVDIIKHDIKEKENQPYYFENLKVEVKDESDEYLCVLIRDILNFLSKREKLVLKLSFFEDKTDIYIAQILNISSMRVGVIKRDSLKKLKNELIV